MRTRTHSRLAFVASTVFAALALGCNGDGGGTAPPVETPRIEILAPLSLLEIELNEVVDVRFLVTGVTATATSRVTAEVVFGTGPSIDVASAVASPPGAEQSVAWDTTGADEGVYRIVVTSSVNGVSAVASAAGLVVLGELPMPAGLVTEGGEGYVVPRTIASGGDGSLVLLAELPGQVFPAVFGGGTPNEVSLMPTAQVQDLVVARYGPDGALAWVRRSEGQTPTALQPAGGNATVVSPAAAACFSDGSCAVLAEVQGTVRFGVGEPSETLVVTPPSGSGAQEQALVLLRFAVDGDLQWARVLAPQSGSLRAPRVVAPPTGRAAVVGSLRGVSATSIGLGAGEPGEVTIPVSSAAGDYLAVVEADGRLAHAQPFPRAGANADGHIGALTSNAAGDLFRRRLVLRQRVVRRRGAG